MNSIYSKMIPSQLFPTVSFQHISWKNYNASQPILQYMPPVIWTTARTGLSGHKAITKHLPSGSTSPLLWSVLARALSIVFRRLGLELKKWDFNLPHIPLIIHPHCGERTCCLDNGEATARANYVLLDGALDMSSGMKCLI